MSTEALIKKEMSVVDQALLLKHIPIVTFIILLLETFQEEHVLKHVPTIIQDHSQQLTAIQLETIKINVAMM